MIFGFICVDTASAQNTPPDGFGLKREPVTLKIDSIIEDRLGVVAVFYTADKFPVEVSIGDKKVIIDRNQYEGAGDHFASFDELDPQMEEGSFKRSYVAAISYYGNGPVYRYERTVILSHPPRKPL